MKTNIFKKYWKHFALVVLLSLNLCIRYTPSGMSIGMQQTYANQPNTGCTWLDNFLMLLLNNPGIYEDNGDGVWTNVPEAVCSGHYIIAYQTIPSFSPVIPSTSDLWCLMPSTTPEWSYWDYPTGSWKTTPSVCTCCGHSPCTCTICRCCSQKKCNCRCPIITFICDTYPINGNFVEYIWTEGWGISYGGCSYSGYLSTSSNSYSCSAAMRITNSERSSDAVFGGKTEYIEDNIYAGIAYLSSQGQGSSIYDSSYTNLGSCSETIMRTPCQKGEIEVSLYFTICTFFVGNNNCSVYQHKFQITSNQIPEL